MKQISFFVSKVVQIPAENTRNDYNDFNEKNERNEKNEWIERILRNELVEEKRAVRT